MSAPVQEFAIPANVAEALAIINAVSAGVTVENPGGDAFRPAEVMALIGEHFLFYTSAYCAWAQKNDGLWKFYDFTKGTPFWLEDLRTGELSPINGMARGAAQLLSAVTDAPGQAYTPTFQDQLQALRAYVSRYGTIVDDAACEIDGNHDRLTTYLVEGKRVVISMHNGDVSHVRV